MSDTCDMLQLPAGGNAADLNTCMACFIKQLNDGELPESLGELAALGRSMVAAEKLGPAAVGMIVAAAKESFGPRRGAEWAAWCRDELSLKNANYRCHLVQVGNMLNGLRKNQCFIKQYRTLIGMNLDNLLAIARIPATQLIAFLSHHPAIGEFDRGAVRAAVAEWLEEEPKERPEQPSLPGFDDALDTFSRLDSGALREAVCDPQKAAHSLRAGIGLLGAALAYELNQTAPDTGTLQMTRAALLAEAHKIEQRLAEFGELE